MNLVSEEALAHWGLSHQKKGGGPADGASVHLKSPALETRTDTIKTSA